MRSLAVLVLVLTLISGGIAATAQEKAVSVPLGLYSLPELARLLTADGRIVACPPSFAHRAALVRLDNLPWDKARAALEAVFDVHFRQADKHPDVWTMEPDHEVEARQERWLARLAELTVEAARESVHDYLDLAHLTFEDIVRAYVRADEERRQLKLVDPEMERDETQAAETRAEVAGAFTEIPVYFGTRMAATLRASDIVKVMKAVQRFQRVDLGDLRASPAMRELVAHKLAEIRRDQAQALPENRSAYEAAIKQTEQVVSQPWTMLARLDFDPIAAAVRAQIVTQSGNRAEESMGFYADAVQDRWLEVFPKLGKEAAEWLAKDDEERGRLLKDSTATRHVKFEAGRLPDSLSQWLESWAAQTGSQIVMELQPSRESLPSRDATDFAVAQPLPDSAPEQQADADTLSGVLSTSEPGVHWSVHRIGDAWILVDRLAFVDRLRDRPISALISLEKKLRREGGRSRATYRFSELASFHQQVRPEESAALGSLTSYRDLDLTLLATSRPAIQVLASISASRRGQLTDHLASGKPLTIPLSSLSIMEIASIAASMREMALSPRGYAVPESALTGLLAEDLKRYSLLLRPAAGKPNSVVAAFILTNPGPEDIAEDLLEVEMPGLFIP